VTKAQRIGLVMVIYGTAVFIIGVTKEVSLVVWAGLLMGSFGSFMFIGID